MSMRLGRAHSVPPEQDRYHHQVDDDVAVGADLERRKGLDSTHTTALGMNKPPPWLQETCLIKAYSSHFSRVASSKCERAAEEYRLWL
jgi:hypothetical protein